jgi:MoxR-like ATPase
LQSGDSISGLLERLERSVVGQESLLRSLVVALLAGGHVLIEGVPGLAKTRAVRALAQALDLPFRRIQFTPDLLPADLTGTLVYQPNTGSFVARPGPIVTSVLLADEINRAPAKVQSALLEAMQEHQVTIGDETMTLPDPFWVLATQNPIEHEGTYPLPEAQLDRFLMKLVVGYPAREAELRMIELTDTDRDELGPQTLRNPPLMNQVEVRELRQRAGRVAMVPAIKAYVVDLVRATRDPASAGLPELAPMIELGASPRATLALVRSARAHAFVSGRSYVTPHDVKSVAHDVLRHRVLPSFEADAESLNADAILTRILDQVPVP